MWRVELLHKMDRMKYYLDTEFIEGKQDKRFLGFKYGETPPTIDLISIGIVSEDGREYYAISKDFNLYEAWNRYQMKQVYGDVRNRYPYGVKEYWIRENVLLPIHYELALNENSFNKDNLSYDEWKYIITSRENGVYSDRHFNTLQKLINKYGKTNREIAEEVKDFCRVPCEYDFPEFYAYYADYDWVVFCQLFGTMNDLPSGFPMYCTDLKQILDNIKFECPNNLEMWGKELKQHPHYPKQENEHNALADAKWNKKLHNFLNSL